jgi:Tol biopolymer transport system component
MVDVLNITDCVAGPNRTDEFPAQRFVMEGYNTNPNIDNFTWDGEYLFLLTGGKSTNGGFGELYLYNSDLNKGQKINPNVGCCYRDPSWSPDGSHFVFAYQNLTLGEARVTEIYLVSYGSLGTGIVYTPIPLPEGFAFSNKRDRPLPILRPAKP